MKRHRIVSGDFDTRPSLLATEILDDWEDVVKESWRRNKRQTEEELIYEFGQESYEIKRQNFIDVGAKPMSDLWHSTNRFLAQNWPTLSSLVHITQHSRLLVRWASEFLTI